MARREFPCPHCTQTVSVLAAPGTPTRCRKCHEEVRVPIEAEGLEKRSVRCEGCGHDFETSTPMGKRVSCPACKASVRVPIQVEALEKRAARCEACGREFETSTPMGKRISCPGCGESVRVPLSHPADVGRSSETEDVGARVRARSSETEDVGARVRARSSETEPEPALDPVPGIVFACGLGTTALALVIVAAGLSAQRPVYLLGIYIMGLPIGSLAFGAVAASGYVWAAKRFARGTEPGAFPYLVALVVTLDYLAGQLLAWTLIKPRDADDNPLGALEWFDLLTRSLSLGPMPLGAVGYLVRVVEVVAIAFGALHAYRLAHDPRAVEELHARLDRGLGADGPFRRPPV